MPSAKPLTREEERELWRRWVATRDPAVRERFIMSMYGLVCERARHSQSNVPMEDRVQAGMLGVMRAFDKFDPSINEHFATYAGRWIDAEQRNLYRKNRTILSGTALRGQRSDEARRAVRVLSIDGDDRSSREEPQDRRRRGCGPTLPQLQQQPPDEYAETDVARLHEAMADAGLTPRETTLIKIRYGNDQPTLAEAGRRMGITRERARQLELEALRKLRRAFGKQEREE